MNKTEYELNNEITSHLQEFSENNPDVDHAQKLSGSSQISPINTHSQTRLNIGPAKMLGVKKHRTVISYPKPDQLSRAESSSPVIKIRTRTPKDMMASLRTFHTRSDSAKPKRTNSTISVARTGIRQGLVNIGKFLQAAQYVITLTLVFSIAWLPLLAVVCADTMTRNFNEGFHKIEG